MIAERTPPNVFSNALAPERTNEMSFQSAIAYPKSKIKALFLIVFLESKVEKSMSNAPTYGRLSPAGLHWPISGLLTCSQNRKNRCFSKESWKVAQGGFREALPQGAYSPKQLSQSTIYLQTSTLPIASTIQPSPHVPFDPHLNYSRHLSSLSSIYYSESLFPIHHSPLPSPLPLYYSRFLDVSWPRAYNPSNPREETVYVSHRNQH